MSTINLTISTNDETLAEMCQQYWLMDDDGAFVYTVTQVAETFGIPTNRVNKLVQPACQAVSLTIRCATCTRGYSYSNRAEYYAPSYGVRKNGWTCENCIAQARRKRIEQQEIAAQEKRTFLRSHFDLSKSPLIDPREFSLYDVVYYVSLVRAGAVKDMSYIQPTATLIPRLSPSPDLDKLILDHLYKLGFITIHPESRLDAFAISGNTVRFDSRHVMWVPRVSYARIGVQETIPFFEGLLQLNFWPTSWIEQIPSLGRQIAITECLEYLLHSLSEHHLPFKVGEKTIQVFNLALEYFSVAQIYNFIWRAVQNAASYYLREDVTPQQAANSVVSRIQGSVDRYREAGWEVKPFERSYALPQTVISQVFFNTGLHIGDDGFTLPSNQWSCPEPFAKEVLELRTGNADTHPTSGDMNKRQGEHRSHHVERSKRAKKRKKRKR